jgi:hypothetical protein
MKKDKTMNALTVAKEIGGTLLEDNSQWTNRFEIKSETSSRLYTIAQRKSDGSWACSCPGWKRWRQCKHLEHLSPALRQLGKRKKT